jgi:signal peptide peptidase SppA
MYENILSRVYNTPHPIHPDKLEAIRRFVTARALGVQIDAAAIAAARADRKAAEDVQINRSVAVLPIMGTLAMRVDMLQDASGGCSCEAIGRRFDQLLADDTVGAILLNIHSPGGDGFGVTELAHKIFDARGKKPTCAICNAEMASAALWIGLAAEEVSITPSGWIGSLGVYMVHTDLSAQNEELGQKVSYIQASWSPHKTEWNADEPLPEDTRAYYQNLVDEIYDQFVADVATFRGTTAEKVQKGYGQGRMMRAAAAKKCGMVDRIETFDECLARLAGVKKAKSSSRAKAERERLALERFR